MSLEADHRLKQLRARRSKLAAEHDAARVEHEASVIKLESAQLQLARVDDAIADLESAQVAPVVSDHAMLRYLERARGLDVEAVKREILSDQTTQQIDTLGSGKYPIGGGLKAVVKNKTVVTVVGRRSD